MIGSSAIYTQKFVRPWIQWAYLLLFVSLVFLLSIKCLNDFNSRQTAYNDTWSVLHRNRTEDLKTTIWHAYHRFSLSISLLFFIQLSFRFAENE